MKVTDRVVLGKLLKEIPNDLRRRVQSLWVFADEGINIDFAPEGGREIK